LAFDREGTLKKAEKLLRQGRLDQAIAEYEKVIENQPKDWAAANSLGDLYVRAGKTAEAAAQYARIAKHFADDGFFPKAAALYKKILKIHPDDEDVQLEWADVAVQQGLLADAKAQLAAVAKRRRARGDNFGADQILIRLGSLDPTDFDARRTAAMLVETQGDEAAAADRYRQMAADLEQRDRVDESLAALREAVRLDPADSVSRARLATAAVAAGRPDEARKYLNREVAGSDPALLEMLAGMSLDAGQIDEGTGLLKELIERDPPIPDIASHVVDLALNLAGPHPEAGKACLDLIVQRRLAESSFGEAAALLMEFVTRAPREIPALLELIEISVDGGLESMMYEAQTLLADAYLAAEKATEACVIAEDLVAREPWVSAHIDRFRRALVMQGTPNPDAVIAERLSGESPFTATDPFAEPLPPEPEPEPEPAPAVKVAPGPAPEPAPAPVQPPKPPARPPAPRDPAFQVTFGGIDLQGFLEESTPQAAPPAPAQAAAPAPAQTPAPAQPAPAPAQGNLDTVFKKMRRQAGQGAGEGGAQDLALAETYLEMGMDDEAMMALESAVRSPRHRFRAATLLARLFKKKGEIAQAIEWMERATQAPPTTPDDGYALLYELGVTLEGQGETARALAIFLELQAEAGDYRDVSSRVDRLARVQTGG